MFYLCTMKPELTTIAIVNLSNESTSVFTTPSDIVLIQFLHSTSKKNPVNVQTVLHTYKLILKNFNNFLVT